MSATLTNPSLSWIDRPMRELVRQAWPISISMLSFSAMTMVDTLFVGRLGPTALAGVGLGGVIAFSLVVFAVGALRGVKVLVSQAVGAGRRAALPALLTAGLAIALVAGVVTLLGGQLVAALLPRAVGDGVGEAAGLYLGVRMLGAPLMLTYTALRETLYGLGDTRSPMRATVTANLANIALVWLFVGHLGGGVAAAAWATVIAHGIEAGLLIAHMRGERVTLRLERATLGEAWRMGWPNGVQMLIEVGSFAMLSLLIASMGPVEMAAHQIALQIIYVSFLPAFAIGEAASVLAGQAVGARRDDLVRRVARLALALAGGYTAACTVALVTAAPSLAGGFTDDGGVVAVAVRLLHLAAIFQIVDAFNLIGRGVLRGTGDVRFCAIVGIGLAWATLPPLTWLLGRWLGLGAVGGWIALLVEIALAALVFWTRLERGGWRAAAERSRERLAAGAH